MDWKKVILAIFIIAILIFTGYQGYHFIKDRWPKADISQEQRIVELLESNQNIVIKLETRIANIEKRAVGDIIKEKVTIKEGETYEGIKEELIELKKNKEANKEEIAKLREEYEERITEYRASEDKIMIKTGDSKIVIYEDKDGNLVSLNEGVEIIRHKKIEEDQKDIRVGQTKEEINDRFKVGVLYSSGEFTPAISYSLISLKDFSFNVTGYDYEEIKLGLDISYDITGDIEIAGGVGLFDITGMELIRDYYIRAGFKIEF